MGELFTNLLGESTWAVIAAVLLLILAFITAAIVRSLVKKLLTKTKLKDWIGQKNPESYEKIVGFIGKLVHLMVFLLFVPGIFQRLGMTEVSAPILNNLNILWAYVPNILAAVVILWAGFFIAKLVRELLVPVFNRLKIDRLQEKAGITVENTGKLSTTLAYIVYVLILIPVIIAALRALNMQAVADPAIHMLDVIFGFIPNIIAALVILIVGCIIARFAGNIVENLTASSGLDAKLKKHLEGKESQFVLSKVAGSVVHVVLVVFFLVESFGVLHLEVLTKIGNALIAYLPYALAAVLIFLACYIGNGLAQKALQKNGHAAAAIACKVAIYGTGAFLVLSELGIAKELVNTMFILLVAAVAVACALAFGLGGRDFAAKLLGKAESGFARKGEKDEQ